MRVDEDGRGGSGQPVHAVPASRRAGEEVPRLNAVSAGIFEVQGAISPAVFDRSADVDRCFAQAAGEPLESSGSGCESEARGARRDRRILCFPATTARAVCRGRLPATPGRSRARAVAVPRSAGRSAQLLRGRAPRASAQPVLRRLRRSRTRSPRSAAASRPRQELGHLSGPTGRPV